MLAFGEGAVFGLGLAYGCGDRAGAGAPSSPHLSPGPASLIGISRDAHPPMKTWRGP